MLESDSALASQIDWLGPVVQWTGAVALALIGFILGRFSSRHDDRLRQVGRSRELQEKTLDQAYRLLTDLFAEAQSIQHMETSRINAMLNRNLEFYQEMSAPISTTLTESQRSMVLECASELGFFIGGLFRAQNPDRLESMRLIRSKSEAIASELRKLRGIAD